MDRFEMARPYVGVFTIPPTPFLETGEIDEVSLRRCLDFCVLAGAHGIVMGVNSSEAIALTDLERMSVAEITIEHVDHRVPVVIGVSGVSTASSVQFAAHARTSGADSVIAMPPYVRHPPGDENFDFYAAVAAAVEGIPVWIQDYVGPVGTPMSIALLARMINEIEGVDFVKEETALAPQVITAVREAVGDRVRGVMGGMAGRYLMEEAFRGACGTMPACEVTDAHVAVWNAIEARDEPEARRLHTQLLPLLNYEAMYSFTIYKEVLVRRGVIASATTRVPGAGRLDTANHRELDILLDDLAPLLTLGLRPDF